MPGLLVALGVTLAASVTDIRERHPPYARGHGPAGAHRGGAAWSRVLARLARPVYDVTLPTQHAQCEVTGRLDNIRRVSGRSDAPFRGRYYDESDVYKWLEAAS